MNKLKELQEELGIKETTVDKDLFDVVAKRDGKLVKFNKKPLNVIEAEDLIEEIQSATIPGVEIDSVAKRIIKDKVESKKNESKETYEVAVGDLMDEVMNVLGSFEVAIDDMGISKPAKQRVLRITDKITKLIDMLYTVNPEEVEAQKESSDEYELEDAYEDFYETILQDWKNYKRKILLLTTLDLKQMDISNECMELIKSTKANWTARDFVDEAKKVLDYKDIEELEDKLDTIYKELESL
jgi:hypothetical protein